MKRDDNILEEYYVLLSEGNGESRNYTCQDVQKLRSTVKFMVFVDEGVETLIHRLSNHLASGHQLFTYKDRQVNYQFNAFSTTLMIIELNTRKSHVLRNVHLLL